MFSIFKKWQKNFRPLSPKLCTDLQLSIESLEDRILLSAVQDAPLDSIQTFSSNLENSVLAATVGNRIWNDLNGNGRQNFGEAGLEGIEVHLFADGATAPTEIATTNVMGNYAFQNVAPGIYTIEVQLPIGWSVTLANNQGSSDIGDSDADTSGVIGPFELGSGELNLNMDAGLLDPNFVAPAQVGNRVWNDLNGNGIQNVGEAGIADIEVHLISDETGLPVATTTTNANGHYMFFDVVPGTYQVEVVAPEGWLFTAQDNQPNSDIGDSDFDQVGLSSLFQLEEGENNSHVDAGMFARGIAGNRVWNDLNGDGVQNTGEAGIADIQINLYTSGNSTPISTTTTNDFGNYVFAGLNPGDYSIEVIAPTGWHFTTANNQGTSDIGDSDVDANGLIEFSLTSEEVNTNLDAGLLAPGFVAPAWVGNRVWHDFDQDGVQDSSETGIHGIEVLLIPDGGTQPVQTEFTDLDGFFNFKDIAPGDYTISVVAPANFTFTTANQGGAFSDSNANVSGLVETFTLAPGEVNNSIDIGLISGSGFLAGLEIVGQGIDINPDFSPLIERYSVNPSDLTDGISVTAFLSAPTDLLTINGVLVADGEAVPISNLLPGETVQIEVTSVAEGIRVYEIIYLPIGFPTLEVTTLEPGVSDGYMFMSLSPWVIQPPHYIAMVDNYGVPVFVKETAGRPTDFKQHDNGWYSYAERSGDLNEFGRENADEVILDENFNEIARLNVADNLNHTDPHDFLILPNGNYVFLAYNGEVRDGVLYEDSVIQVVDHLTGEELFQWNSKNDIPLEDVLRNNKQEYAHINSVSVDNDGNFLASLRGTSQVVKIDSTTAEVIWKFGGLSSDFVIDDPFGGPCGQHTATRLENGNLMVFDNGRPCPDLPEYANRGELTRAAEYELDEVAMTATLVWSYTRAGFFSTATGSAQRLQNGNTLIGWGRNMKGFATEVDAEGNVVFEMSALRDDVVFHSYRVVRGSLPS